MTKRIKASEIGDYLEQSPEQYQAVLNACAKYCISHAVKENCKPLVAEAQAVNLLMHWKAILPSDDPAGDFLAILEVHYNGLESDYIARTLPLPLAKWYESNLQQRPIAWKGV